MRSTNTTDEKLSAILKEDGVEKPTEAFSNRLVYAVALQHKKKEVVNFTAAKWLGKCILAVLVTFNLIFLYQLHAFASQPVVFISVIAFATGVWGTVAIARKFQLHSGGVGSVLEE